MTTNSFRPGEVYFRVTYADPEMWYPSIEAFVFLGENLSAEDVQDTWYFQPAGDFGKYGTAVAPQAKGRPVVCAGETEALEMLTMEGLMEALRTCARRRGGRFG